MNDKTRQPAPFRPKPMQVSVLTAALQELTPREKRDPDPDLVIGEWLELSRDIGSPCIELSAALHPGLSDVPAEVMAARGVPVQGVGREPYRS